MNALADAAQLSSLADETPEGRSIVVLAKEKHQLRGRELAPYEAEFIPFTAQTRMSGVDYDGREIRKGAVDAIEKYISAKNGGGASNELRVIVDRISREGGTALAVTNESRVMRDESRGPSIYKVSNPTLKLIACLPTRDSRLTTPDFPYSR